METYLINHLRIPNEAGISYLDQVEATGAPLPRRLANLPLPSETQA